ncbi:hypothetical protein IFM61606_10191 [Aspergillus udagawae]|nr:hypothetical protein IFM61606_10191 [Aspergillus udagawae]
MLAVEFRQIRCDRLEPCQSCILAKVACRRNRTRRVRNSNAHTDTTALRDRVARLEDTLRQDLLQTAVRPCVAHQSLPSDTQDDTPHGVGPKQTLQKIPGPERPSTPSPNSSLPENKARDFIQKELSNGGHLSYRQRMTLEASLSLVEKLSKGSSDGVEPVNLQEYTRAEGYRLTHAEILHIIMASKSYKNDSLRPKWLVRFPDFLSAEAIERMGLALLNDTLDEQIALQYRIILLFKGAIIHLVHQVMDINAHADLDRHLNDVMFHRLHAALAAIGEIRFLTAPSLSLLQALLCGALAMRALGNPIGCSTITASASRTLVALGYHNLTQFSSDPKVNEEVRATVSWCYILDKNLALLLFRPQALPPLQIPVQSLTTPGTSGSEENLTPLFLELAQAQETALNLVAVSEQHANGWLITGISSIRRDMANLYRKILNGVRSQLDYQPASRLSWAFLQLNFCSVMASILRLCPGITSNLQLQDECVHWAREALQTLLNLRFSAPERCHHLYTSWSLSSYPLCPIFIVFCNVIRTGNAQDFFLLQRLNTDLTSLRDTNAFMNRLRNLHATLVKLCEPLVHSPPETSSVAPVVAQEVSCSTSQAIDEPQGSINHPTGGSPAGNECTDGPVQLESVSQDFAPDTYGSFFDQDMMGRLFSSNPTAEWINTDALDFVLDFGLESPIS